MMDTVDEEAFCSIFYNKEINIFIREHHSSAILLQQFKKRDKMCLIGPKCDQLGPINIVYLKSPLDASYHINSIWIYNSKSLKCEKRLLF